MTPPLRRTALSRDEARRYLLGHLGLGGGMRRGRAGIRETLTSLGCIQLDPLAPIGTNADLVVLARVERVRVGAVYETLLPGHAFEHFAKERCLVPADAFPQYRDQAVQTPWWRLGERARRVPAAVVESVYEEVAERGPCTSAELVDRGRVAPIDWHGWTSTSKATTMALEILWTRCRLVVAGRRPEGAKVYDLPSRALPAHHDRDAVPFDEWGLRSRVQSAGLLARAGGPCWSMLRDVRTSGLPDHLVAEGQLEEVVVEGSARPYLAPRGFRERIGRGHRGGRMRILGPLDPLLWDRKLVRQAFGFDYIWEVYKPKEKRRWGWYVCPLLHRGQLVGRIEARVREGALVVERLWPEEGHRLDDDALEEALDRHAVACGADEVRWARSARRV